MREIIENKIEEALLTSDLDWFTKSIKGELKRYVVWLTNNIFYWNWRIADTLVKQVESFDCLDNITIWGWLNKIDNITYIDIWTTTDDLEVALALAKLFNQKAIFDLEKLEEILVS